MLVGYMSMPVYLIRIRPELNEWRFYRLDIWPDLFGGVSLVREWGRIGQEGRCRHESYATSAVALEALDRVVTAKRKRGYHRREGLS